MNEVQNISEIARDISDYGFMVVTCSIFLIISMMLMITSFKWFKNVIETIMTNYSSQLDKIQEIANRNNEAIVDIAEGLLPETKLRVKNISNVYFDLAFYKVLEIIKKIREENHIDNREATEAKIRTLLNNIFEDRNSKFDCFKYKGISLSKYVNPEWKKWVERVVIGEIYTENGINEERTKTNVSAVYDNIKLDFYHRLQQ